MYNLKVTHYPDGDRVQSYRRPVPVPGETLRIDPSTGEVIPRRLNPDKFEFNPFSGQVEYMRGFADIERSPEESMRRTMNVVYDLCRSNVWEWFVTLTFDPDLVDSFDFSAVSKALSKWLNNIRSRYAPGLKYVMVPELHKSGRYHFHGLWSDIGSIQMVDSGHRTPVGDVIYNISTYKLGFTTASPVRSSSAASGYISKYITKDLCAVTRGKKRYWASQNCSRSQSELFFVDGPKRGKIPSRTLNAKYVYTYENDVQEVTLIECNGRFQFPDLD